MKVFRLESTDKGITAEGVQFSEGGKVVIQWVIGTRSVELYDSMEDLKSIREHSGRTKIVFTV